MGRAEVLRQGEDLFIAAIGSMVYPSLEAAEALEGEGHSVGVVNCRFAKPIDPYLAELAASTGTLLVVEENIRQGGLGGAVLELFNDVGLDDIRLRRMGLADQFVEHGPPDLLRNNFGLDRAGIIKEAKKLL
jgi:1-deoxy-D-xylulose-5-phosphate synthase